MRIAVVASPFPSLSQTFVLNQITGLIDRGHEVEIISCAKGNCSKFHEEVMRYDLLNRTSYPFELEIMPRNLFLRFLKAVVYSLVFLTKNPVAVFKSLNFIKYGRRAASLSLFFLMTPFLRKKPFDIIHCQFGPIGAAILTLQDIGAIKGKLVTSFRGYDATKFLQDHPGAFQDLFRKGDLFLPVSDFLRRRLIEEGCDTQKILVHRSGIDLSKFKYSARQRNSNEPTKVLTVARLVEKKGIAYAIQAISRVVSSGRRVSYTVVGDGDLRDDLERLIQDLDIKEAVQLVGWRSHGEVIRFLESAHLLMAPSVTAADGDQEGIPNVIKEAMAMGIPVLATRHSGIPELVQDGTSGFLVPERDVEALANKLEYLIRHPQSWPQMGAAGRRHVEANYDVNVLNDQLVVLYESVLGPGNVNSIGSGLKMA